MKMTNPNPSPIGLGFGFVLFGAPDRNRTCTVSHRILNPARLPVPPQVRKFIVFYHTYPPLSSKRTAATFYINY